MQFLKRTVAGLLMTLLLIETTGCTAWRTVDQPWPSAVVQDPGHNVQVVFLDDQVVEADSVRANADSLIMYHHGRVDTVGQVKAVKTLQFSVAKSAGWVLLFGAVLLAGAALVAQIMCSLQECSSQ